MEESGNDNHEQSVSLRVREKFGYSLGDFASNLFWMVFIFYGLFFYTDVFGISAATVGTMFLLTKLWDAINDPIMGIIADRTETRWGKYRPFLLWIVVPFGMIGVLTFTTPDMSMEGKVIYAYVTYTLMMMAYTAINIPYSALMGVLTPSVRERTSISTFRFAAAFAGGIFIQAVTFPLVGAIGGDSDTVITTSVDGDHTLHIREMGTGTVQLKAVFATIPEEEDVDKPVWLEIFELFEDREHIEKTSNLWVNSAKLLAELRPPKKDDGKKDSDPDEQNGNYYIVSGFGEKTVSLVELFDNSEEEDELKIDWSRKYTLNVIDQQKGFQFTVGIFAAIAMVLFLITFFSTRERVHPPKLQDSSVMKDIKDVFSSGPWWVLGVMSMFTLAQVCIRGGAIIFYFKYFVGNTGYAGPFMLAGTIFNLLGVVCTDWLTRVVGGKRRLYLITVLSSAPLMGLFYFLGADDLMLMFVLTAIGGFLSGPMSPIVWAMYADVADYSEWKKGTRATGLFFSAATFAQKMGWTIGGASAGWLLAWYGFEANIEQNAETIHGIKILMSWIPAAGCLIAGILMFFYKLNDKFMFKVEQDLRERRRER